MRLLHSAARTRAMFDDENLVSFAGLVPVMRLAEEVGLHELLADRVRHETINDTPSVFSGSACPVRGLGA